MISISTSRLVIRDHENADLHAMHELYSSSEAMRFLPDLMTTTVDETDRKLVECLAATQQSPRTTYYFAVVNRSDGTYIGEIGYRINLRTDRGCRADLGYFIRKPYWRRGIITEAGHAVLRDAFEERDIRKMTAGCLAENVASERVLLKLGFAKEAALRCHQFHEGTWKDRVEYGLLRTDSLDASGRP
jgi:[ribosomal protein S5]-alanine N-acetyltransferase